MISQVNIIFVSLAQNQSRFFEMVGKRMMEAGYGVAHVCFHEGAVKELSEHGCEVFNPYEYWGESTNQVRFSDYNISNAALLLNHEKAAYELTGTTEIELKFKNHLAALDSIVQGLLKRGGRWCIVQELGGFTPVLASYFVAHRLGIDNWFIEPSFFRGRIFLTRNTFLAPIISASNASNLEEVRATLEQVLKNQLVVVPVKDRQHYRSASKKLLDSHNFRRLFDKILSKYVRREREEFDHIAGHVLRHIRMFVNSRKNSRYYSSETGDQPFIYYPLHVPADFALTIRSPEYLDQYSIIDFLCRIAPLGFSVVIKEHPALAGALSSYRMRELFARHDNLVMLSPSINNHLVLAKAEVIVTINSKSGAEALLHGKPVIVLGNSFYDNCGHVCKVHSLSDLNSVLMRALGLTQRPALDDILPFFQSVWNLSYPGELYDISNKNVSSFSRSLSASFRDSGY